MYHFRKTATACVATASLLSPLFSLLLLPLTALPWPDCRPNFPPRVSLLQKCCLNFLFSLERNHTQLNAHIYLIPIKPPTPIFLIVMSVFVSFCFKSRIQREWREISTALNKLAWLEISIILVFIDFISCSSIFLQSIVSPFPSPRSADAMGA